MKKKYLLPIALSLMLSGCQTVENNNKTPDTQEKDDNKGNNPGGDSGNKGDNPGGDSGNKGDNPGGDSGDKPSGGDDDPKEDPSDESNWDKDTTAAMQKYLGGNLLPYVDLGKGTYCKYNAASTSRLGYLTIYGGEELDAAKLSEFETNYKKKGWDYTPGSSTQATAANDTKHLSVKIYADSDGLTSMDVTYDEPYDKSTITEWTEEVKNEFSTNVHKHGDDIPFVYLGSTYLTTNYNSSSATLTITQGNGKWSDSVLTDAKETLTKEGWNPIDGTATNYSNTVTASKTMSDNCVIKLTLKSNSTTSANYKKAVLEITLSEGYNPEGFTAWPTSFSTYTSQMHNHEIPLIYLGTTNPRVSNLLSSYGQLTLTGKDWKDEMVTNAKKVLSEDKDKENPWKTEDEKANGKDSLLAYKTFSDGCRMCFTLRPSNASTSAVASMVLHYEEPYAPSSALTDWDSDTKATIKEKLGTDIPYVYLNTDTPHAFYYESYKTLAITGTARFNSGMVEKAITDFNAAGWNATGKMSTQGLSMTATLTNSFGTYTATIDAAAYISTEVVLYIRFDEAFYDSDTSLTWPTNISDYMKKNFDGYVLPYIYLGTRNPTASFNNGGTTSTLTIYGGKWDDKIFTIFNTALTEKETTSTVSWTVEKGNDETFGEMRVATAINTASSMQFTVKVYASASKEAMLTFTIQEVFYPPENGAWTTTITEAMKKSFDDHYAPYVYLGTRNPSYATTDSINRMYITGGAWNSQVLDLAKTALQKDGYTVTEGKTANGKCIGAYKLNTDGTSMRICVYRSGAQDPTKAMMDIYYGAKPVTNTSTSWSSANQALIDSTLGGYKLPYLSTGSVEMTASTTNNVNQLSFTAEEKNAITPTSILQAAKTLNEKDNNKWKFEFDWSTSSYAAFLYGTLTQDDGSKVYLSMYTANKSNIYMNVTYAPKYDSTKTGSYSSDIQAAMKDRLNGYVPPYLYLNLDDNKVTYGTNASNGITYLFLQGGIYDEKMQDTLIATLDKDTNTWNYSYDYSDGKLGKVLVASTTLEDGTSITIKLYGSKLSYGYSITRLYFYCY